MSEQKHELSMGGFSQNRRQFVKAAAALTAIGVAGAGCRFNQGATPEVQLQYKPIPIPTIESNNREYWISVLTKIADPVLLNLSQGTLRKNMPVEKNSNNQKDRSQFSHLEAFGRLIAGIAPWLELGPDETEEGRRRSKYLSMARKSIENAVDPASPDFMRFTSEKQHSQELVDTAHFTHGLLRAPVQLFENLDEEVKKNIIAALKSSRAIKPVYNNWLLFSAIVEAFLYKTGNGGDIVRMDYAVRKHMEWYLGDGMYGDGNVFHWDYYNGYVIHPMLLDVLKVLADSLPKYYLSQYDEVLQRARRYAAIQERLISPGGTFPPIGRSLAYRFGAFQALGQVALMGELPDKISPPQVRSALSAVIGRMAEAPGMFDEEGWLKIGFVGSDPDIGEDYTSTGSLYLCSVGLIPLGLPASDPFWSAPAESWTSKRVWEGYPVPRDQSI